eukprot:CAMPEP_0117657216 /NCGR_PEP_ID=MMETSP0804-20121206/5213_1 /TAXON_ID=1074897 /ORGANISM="Tetraselmis astigmatica, Strain CCMP880" /LENGTH=166 /DNA_ID=CAMNT_0005463657 /DNA_START=327 /DNA_END=828 /DNA_ORIENTATION=-
MSSGLGLEVPERIQVPSPPPFARSPILASEQSPVKQKDTTKTSPASSGDGGEGESEESESSDEEYVQGEDDDDEREQEEKEEDEEAEVNQQLKQKKDNVIETLRKNPSHHANEAPREQSRGNINRTEEGKPLDTEIDENAVGERGVAPGGGHRLRAVVLDSDDNSE